MYCVRGKVCREINNMKARSWCFTINNPTDNDKANVKVAICRYIIVGEERGAEGTPHLQGYITFDNAKSRETVERLLGGRAHLTCAEGTALQNRVYCTKQSLFHEAGVMPTQGKRNDIGTAKDLIKMGRSMQDVIDTCESYQAVRYAELIRKYEPCSERTPPEVWWFFGETGTGKTRTAIEEAGHCKSWWISMPGNLTWWQGYDGQEAVVIDDLRPHHCDYAALLRYLDRYPVQVPMKGSSTWLKATKIWITSPYPPSNFGGPEGADQLVRRLAGVRRFM